LRFVPIRQTTSCSSGALFALAVALQRRYLLGSRFFARSKVLGLRCHRRGRNRNRTTGANSTRALPPTGSVRAFTRRSGGCQQCDAGGTAPLDHIVHHLALALGGRSAASFARRLMLPVSNDTSTPRAQTRHSGLRGLDSSRDRRLGVATQPALRDNHLRSRTSQNDRVAPRLRTQRPRFCRPAAS
jgi:hypothetical protein